MKVHFKVMAIIVLFLTLAFGTTPALASRVNPYWARISNGLPNSVIVLSRSIERVTEVATLKASIPFFWGLSDLKWQDELNESVAHLITRYLATVEQGAEEEWEYYKELDSPGWPFHKHDAQVDFEVKYNAGGLISIPITYYQYTGGAHGMHWTRSLNFDLTTGLPIHFEDIFPDTVSKESLVEVINEELLRSPEMYFIPEVTLDMLSSEHLFYLEPGAIVAYFDLYEISPYASGIPKFRFEVGQ